MKLQIHGLNKWWVFN